MAYVSQYAIITLSITIMSVGVYFFHLLHYVRMNR